MRICHRQRYVSIEKVLITSWIDTWTSQKQLQASTCPLCCSESSQQCAFHEIPFDCDSNIMSVHPNKLVCCGYHIPLLEATVSPLCYLHSKLPMLLQVQIVRLRPSKRRGYQGSYTRHGRWIFYQIYGRWCWRHASIWCLTSMFRCSSHAFSFLITCLFNLFSHVPMLWHSPG